MTALGCNPTEIGSIPIPLTVLLSDRSRNMGVDEVLGLRDGAPMSDETLADLIMIGVMVATILFVLFLAQFN